MPRNFDWQVRIKAVEFEYLAVRQAVNHFRPFVARDPTLLRDGLQPRDLDAAARNLDATYLIRLFAEFESGAGQFWRTEHATQPATTDLLNGLTARGRIPDRLRADAQAVRAYRNHLVHQRDGVVDPVPLATARRHLCRFFSYLPPSW